MSTWPGRGRAASPGFDWAPLPLPGGAAAPAGGRSGPPSCSRAGNAVRLARVTPASPVALVLLPRVGLAWPGVWSFATRRVPQRKLCHPTGSA